MDRFFLCLFFNKNTQAQQICFVLIDSFYCVMIIKKTLPFDLATFFYFLKGSSSSKGIRVYSENSLKVTAWCFYSLLKQDFMSPKSKSAFLSLQPLMLAMSFVVIQILYGIFFIPCYKILYRDLILYVFKNNK